MEDDIELRAHPNFYTLIDLIINETQTQRDVLTANLRLKHAYAKNEKEKNEITTSLKEKTKNKIVKYKGVLEDYFSDALNYKGYFEDGSAHISFEVHNIGYCHLKIEDLNELTKESLKSYNHLKDKDFYSIKPFVDYVKYISLVSLYQNLTELQKEISDDTQTIGEIESTLPKWFPIGLGFAKGEIQNKIKVLSARDIAKEFTKASDTNYVSLTGLKMPIDPKNIYSDWKKLKLVYDYCIDNEIEMSEDFIDAYNTKQEKMN